MDRWFGFADDPTAGGSKLEDLQAAANLIAPTSWVPVTTGAVDPGLRNLDRNNEIRGRRGNTKPFSFASEPVLSFEARAYPKLCRPLVRKAFSGTITSTGVAPAAISSTVGPIETGSLQAIIGWLRRESELDRVAGAVVSELEMNFPIDEEGTLTATLPALYHDVDAAASATDPDGAAAVAAGTPSYAGHDWAFMCRDAIVYEGAAAVEIPNFAGFGFSFSNALIDDFRSRFRPNHNIETVTIDAVRHDLWYPARHKLGAQVVTLRIDLSDVDAAREQKRKFLHADKFVFEVAAGPLGTTPAADEMMRLTFYNAAPTGGGPEPIQREGDQVASYEYTAYVSEADANQDISATFVGAAALT